MEKWSEGTLRGGDTEIQESQDSLVSGHEIMEEETQRAPGTPVPPWMREVAPETPVEPEIKVALDCLNEWQVLRESEVEALLSRLESFATHKEKLDCLASLQCEQLTKAFKENHKRKLETEEPETHVDPETFHLGFHKSIAGEKQSAETSKTATRQKIQDSNKAKDEH